MNRLILMLSVGLTVSCLMGGCKSSDNMSMNADTQNTETPNPAPSPESQSFQDFLNDWYADYDAEQTNDYLDNLGTLGTETINGVDYEVRRDMPYGPHGERTSMDVYFPSGASSATPLVLFMHGGGFSAKNKMDVLGNRAPVLAGYLENNIAVASINYRFKSIEVSETVVDPNWNCSGTAQSNNGCRLDVIYRDGARAVQYVRYQSELLNIDPNRIGAWGRSAGSQIVTWVALVPDLAVADHEDPVLQESTRLQVFGHTNSQVTGASFLWPELVIFQREMDECDPFALWERLASDDETTGYNTALQANVDFLTNDPQGQELMRIVHFLDHLDSNAPPMVITTPVKDYTCEELGMLSDDQIKGKMLHHPGHSEPFYQRCLEEKGEDECKTVTDIQDTLTDENDAWKNDEVHVLKFMTDILESL